MVLAVSFCSGLLAFSFPFYMYIFLMSVLDVVQNLPRVYTFKFYGFIYGNLRFTGIAILISDLTADLIYQGSFHGSHGCVAKNYGFLLSPAKIDQE